MNFKKIKETYIALYHECLDFIIEPNNVWGKVANEKITWAETRSKLLYPLLGLICVLGLLRVFIENFYIADYDFLTKILSAISWPILLVVSLLVGAMIIRPIFSAYTKQNIDFERIVVFLTYVEIPLFISASIFALMDFMFAVLILLNFYTLYVIMLGYNVYFADVLGEDKKYNYITTLFTFMLVYALTYIAWWALAKF